MLHSHVHSPGSPQYTSGLGKYWIKSLVLSHEDKNILRRRRLTLWCSYPSSLIIYYWGSSIQTKMVSRVHYGFCSCLTGTQIQMTGSVHPTLTVLLALWMYMTPSLPILNWITITLFAVSSHTANTRAPVPYSLCGYSVSEWRVTLWFVCYC